MAETITVTSRKYVRGVAPGDTFQATQQDAAELYANGLIEDPKAGEKPKADEPPTEDDAAITSKSVRRHKA